MNTANPGSALPGSYATLELDVNNHAGVMTHVCSVFSRRGFNVEAILVLPTDDGAGSRIWLRVAVNGRLEQLIRQLNKLEDVHDVRRLDAGHDVFARFA